MPRVPSLLLAFSLAVGCDEPDPYVAPDSGGPEDDTGCEELQTFYPDEDGDGYGVPGDTVQACDKPPWYADNDEDCDDSDYHVFPGSPYESEKGENGKDEDCDGRVDELWQGVTVAYQNQVGASSILTLDALGQVTDEVVLADETVYPYWLDHGVGGGWVTNYTLFDKKTKTITGQVLLIDEAGQTRGGGEVPDLEWGFYGLATHPDGYYLVSSVDALWRVDPDGTATQLASWNAEYWKLKDFQLLLYTVAVDVLTGEVGLVGYLGGFATWSEKEGLQIRRIGDAKEWSLMTYSGAHKDGGGWYSLAQTSNGLAISKYNLETDEWVEKVAWEETWSPAVLTINGDNGDYLVSANGGWYYTVWLILEDGSYVSDLYMTDGTVQYRGFYGITGNY